MILNVQEQLTQVWENVKPWVVAFTSSAVGSAIIGTVFSVLFRKKFSVIDYEKVVLQTEEKTLSKIGDTTLSIHIEPIVDKRLDKIEDKAKEVIDDRMNKLEKKLDKNIALLEWVCDIYKDSLAVSEEQKKALENIKSECVEKVEPVIEITSIQGITKFDEVKEEPIKETTKLRR